jgi:hypothetical protein
MNVREGLLALVPKVRRTAHLRDGVWRDRLSSGAAAHERRSLLAGRGARAEDQAIGSDFQARMEAPQANPRLPFS